jgi:hypothetical protein
MSAPPFVQSLRSRRQLVTVGAADGAALNLRVEIPDVWDVVRVAAAPSASVGEVKRAAVEALAPGSDPERFVVKLRGIEVLDEGAPLTEAGAVEGSILLVTHRRRRPVR